MAENHKAGFVNIVGNTNVGKTTLMNIIAGFYEIADEQVFINDIDINEYSREALFENIGYAMQKNIIMDDTIKNNIDIRKEASARQIIVTLLASKLQKSFNISFI